MDFFRAYVMRYVIRYNGVKSLLKEHSCSNMFHVLASFFGTEVFSLFDWLASLWTYGVNFNLTDHLTSLITCKDSSIRILLQKWFHPIVAAFDVCIYMNITKKELGKKRVAFLLACLLSIFAILHGEIRLIANIQWLWWGATDFNSLVRLGWERVRGYGPFASP